MAILVSLNKCLICIEDCRVLLIFLGIEFSYFSYCVYSNNASVVNKAYASQDCISISFHILKEEALSNRSSISR